MLIWQVKDSKDRVIFESESYKECLDYMYFWNRFSDDGLYLDYKVIIWG